MKRLVNNDLGLKSLAMVQVQQLTPLHRQRRLEMCTAMINKLKGKLASKILVFSDKKDFHLSKHLNRRNNRTLVASTKAVDLVNRFQGRPKFPKKAMFFGFIGTDGKAFPGIWVKGTMDAAQYKSILIRKVFPILDATYGKGNYIWTQDWASVHMANTILTYLENRLGSEGFWSRGIWPPNSCNLNPLDFSMWNHVNKRANDIYHTSIDAMKAAMERVAEHGQGLHHHHLQEAQAQVGGLCGR